MRIAKPQRRSAMDVKMTPMIDVVFQLLIFFVCTVSFQALEEILPADLKAAGGVASKTEIDPELLELEELVIRVESVDGRTQWSLNGRVHASLTDLRSVLRRLVEVRSDMAVILDIDPEIAMGDVIDVYDTCRMAGFKRIHFAAKASP